MKAIFHAYDAVYPMIKANGFSHVEISMGAWPGTQDKIFDAIDYAHRLGLNCILAPWQYTKSDDGRLGLTVGGTGDGITLLNNCKDILSPSDIIYLPDEPNLNNIDSAIVLALTRVVHNLTECKSMAIFSWIRPADDYENTADIVGFDFYKTNYLDFLTIGKTAYRIWKLKRKHEGLFIGAPAIRKSVTHIKNQIKFWKWFGIKDLCWYSWSGNGGEYGYKDLKDKPEFLEALKCV